MSSSILGSSSSPARNRLAQASSPYLLQHAGNPVDWMEWGPEAFARATAEGKPVLLSVGYAACHWCHVMAHESFEDPAIAAVQNELFVSIKVDREERPDIDAIYQNALALLGEQGGWPLTMFLTPDGEPFWGGTYFPPVARWGRIGFPDLLRNIAATYARETDKVAGNVAALKAGLARVVQAAAGPSVSIRLLNEIAAQLVGDFDAHDGGLGTAPKFPRSSMFEFILRAWLRTGQTVYRDTIETTLDHICQGGIYDHLGGGFARYSTDAQWLAPHFEKMLYDNAQLIRLLTLAWQATGKPLYAVRVRETVDWALREMLTPDGGFASSLDADSEGEEGKFYVWSKDEIDATLGPDAALFDRVYDVTAEGNWEHKVILHRNHPGGAFDPAMETELAPLREKLFAVRAVRVRPGWDDKVLADWNGLMIAALAEAGFTFGEQSWISVAEQAFGAVTRHEKDGRLAHCWRAGRASAPGLLEDYAAMADAALALYQVAGRTAYIDAAKRWVTTLDRQFWDAKSGGYFQGADDGERLIVRSKTAADYATPAGNGTMVGVLARLALATGDNSYATRAETLVTTFSGGVGGSVYPLAMLLNGVDFATGAVEIVIAGDRSATDTMALLDVVRKAALPNRWLTIVGPDAALPESHPAFGKGQIGGQATAYVCRARSCSAPVTDVADFERLLSGKILSSSS